MTTDAVTRKDVRILVVDDDEDTRAATAALLSQAGYAALEAGTCREGLAAITTMLPSLVLLDRELPDGDGLDLCRRVKSSPALRETMVVIVSAAMASSKDQTQGLEAGADGYVTRPIGNRALLARVDAFVRLAAPVTELRRRAEALLDGRPEEPGGPDAAEVPLRILHELRVHQIELELQNDELRQSQLAVERERDRYALLYHHAPIGYATLDENAVVRELNGTLCALLGRETEEVVGKPFHQLLEGGNGHVFLSRWRAFFRSPEGKVLDLVAAGRDGEERSLVLTGRRAPEDLGAPAAGPLLQAVLQDMTARRLAERRLSASNAVLRMVSTLNESLLRRGAARAPVFEEACRVAVDQGGYAAAFISEGSGPGGEAALLARAGEAAAAEDRGAPESLTSFPLVPGGGGGPVLTIRSAAGLPIEAQEAELLGRFAEDVGFGLRFVAEQEQRRRAEEALRAALAEKEALLREVHHRVKNNLQAVIFLVEGYREAIQGEREKALLGELQAKTRAMALVYQQLHGSRDLAAVKMGDYLARLASLLREALDAKGNVALEVEVKPSAGGRELEMDVERAVPCGLVVNELVTNALKYAVHGAEAPRIRVALAREGPSFRLEVEDNGPGLPPRRERRTSSMGLGLVELWVRHQLGGTLREEDGPGARFEIEFPAGAEAPG